MAHNLRKHGVYRYEADKDWGSIFTVGQDYRCLTDGHLICNSGNEILIGSLIRDFQLVTHKHIPNEKPKEEGYLAMPSHNSIQKALDRLNLEIRNEDPEWDDSKAWEAMHNAGIRLDCAYREHANNSDNWYPVLDPANHVFSRSVSEPIVFRRRNNDGKTT